MPSARERLEVEHAWMQFTHDRRLAYDSLATVERVTLHFVGEHASPQASNPVSRYEDSGFHRWGDSPDASFCAVR